MLTDIFADRYASIQLWESFSEIDRKFLVQGFRMVSEQLYPYWSNGKINPSSVERWAAIHDKLSMELGLTELSPKYYIRPATMPTKISLNNVCQSFVCADYNNNIPPDRFMKERISFIELAFRERAEQLKIRTADDSKEMQEAKIHDKTPQSSRMRLPGKRVDGLKSYYNTLNTLFQTSVDELNERLRRAGYNLNYHNGFIQISDDKLIEKHIEHEFWAITNNDKWKNVDIDMKEAIDLRDSNGRDPAFHAACALESTIKIISDMKGWTNGSEKGAHNYLDNLGSKKNGQFINEWEKKILKDFFTSVRNPFGHGPGKEKMPKLSLQQTNWAIETSMSWIKSLVRRM